MLFQTKDDNIRSSFQNKLLVLAAVGLIYKTFVLAYVGSYTYDKAKRIAITVNQLYAKIEDERIKQEVEITK